MMNVNTASYSKDNMERGRTKKRAADQEEVITESQQVRALSSYLTKPKGDEKEIQQFRAKVVADRRTMDALLQQRLRQAEKDDAHRRNEISNLITDTLTKSDKTSSGEPATFANTKIVGNDIYSSAVKIHTACRSMLSEYDSLEATIAQLGAENKDTATEKWVQDVDDTERLLRLGHKTAVRNVKKVLGAEAEDAEIEGAERGIGVQKELNMELLNGLRYAERGVKRMVKGLSKDEH